jgi:ketosteroid isomerase-like protein
VPRRRWSGIAAVAVVAALVGVLVLVVGSRREHPPEELIQHKVVQMAANAEKKDLSAIMKEISADFRGTRPALTREELRAVLAAQILGGNWLRVFIREMEVTVTSPTDAAFRGKFIFGRSQADTLEKLASESRIQAYQVDATLRKEDDGEWRFVSGGYRVLPPGELF